MKHKCLGCGIENNQIFWKHEFCSRSCLLYYIKELKRKLLEAMRLL